MDRGELGPSSRDPATGIVKRLPNLIAWLEATRPDAVCLQELKAEQTAFPAAALRDAGYHAVWAGGWTDALRTLHPGTPP